MGIPSISAAGSVIAIFDEKAEIPTHAREVSKFTGPFQAIRVATTTRQWV